MAKTAAKSKTAASGGPVESVSATLEEFLSGTKALRFTCGTHGTTLATRKGDTIRLTAESTGQNVGTAKNIDDLGARRFYFNETRHLREGA